jgi:nicotinic acid phosphoribosyltransferase
MTTDPIACLFNVDAYKLGHVKMYQAMGDVTRLYSNWTNRKSRMPGVEKVVHFGLQAHIQRHLMDAFEPFFALGTSREVWSLYKRRLIKVLGEEAADTIGTDHIEHLWALGYLPLRFCAVPEGTLVPIGVPSFTVENTHPEFAWLTNYIEPGLSNSIWGPSTSATIAHEYRKVLDAAALQTGADLGDVALQCHDFSYRGMLGGDGAAASAAGHLLSFEGSDSLPALGWIERYYGGPFELRSVPATEHSVMSLGIAAHGELETFRRLLKLHPTGVISIVADTFDLWKVLTEILPALKDEIMSRDGKLVIRPDSGDPGTILLGDPNSAYSAAYEGVVRLLLEEFGGVENDKGFMELDPHVGVIYGDSITLDRAKNITHGLNRMGFSSTTVTLGVGSFTYQFNTRDTFGSAMKATWAEVDGKGVNLFKDPVTDDGTKRSAKGRLAVCYNENEPGGMRLYEQAWPEIEAQSLLQPVWEDGQFLQHQTFQNVRDVLNG